MSYFECPNDGNKYFIFGNGGGEALADRYEVPFLGGIPIATALSLRTGIPAAFVRKEAKKYGTARLAEGADIEGRRVTVVEDVITTGGQVVISTNDLRVLGANVEHVLCVIDRSPDQAAALTAAGLQLHALLTRAQLDAAESRKT